MRERMLAMSLTARFSSGFCLCILPGIKAASGAFRASGLPLFRAPTRLKDASETSREARKPDRLSRSAIELVPDGLKCVIGVGGKIAASGQTLSQRTMEAPVAAPLPGRAGIGEIAALPHRGVGERASGELAAVAPGKHMHTPAQGAAHGRLLLAMCLRAPACVGVIAVDGPATRYSSGSAIQLAVHLSRHSTSPQGRERFFLRGGSRLRQADCGDPDSAR
jgi:hypothetical protein